jgi:two-component system catabolic regulation response regulator CreB/two-component system response regulator ChvI
VLFPRALVDTVYAREFDGTGYLIIARVCNYIWLRWYPVSSNSGASKGRILIVDDEEDVTSILRKGLEKSGYTVITYNDPVDALDDFKPGSYDLILLDIKMPKIDGFELFQQIQMRDGNAKVCFMTAYEVYYDSLKELFPDSYSSMCFIKKPFAIHEFVKRISNQMGDQK